MSCGKQARQEPNKRSQWCSNLADWVQMADTLQT